MPVQQETQRQQTTAQTNDALVAGVRDTARPDALKQLESYLGTAPTAASTARFLKKLQGEGALGAAMLVKARDLIQSTCGNDYVKEVVFHLQNKSRAALPAEFDKMWEAHPHNYQEDESQNTDSGKVQEDLGWKADTYGNTCAIRLSTMFNKLGGDYKIDRTKAEKAGIPRERVVFAPATKTYILLSAKEVWTYVTFWFGKAHMEFPAGKRFKDEAEYQTAYETEIQPYLQGRKGIVAFDKIFGYGGTGHVDLFDGEKLSDSNTWYPSQSIKLWMV